MSNLTIQDAHSIVSATGKAFDHAATCFRRNPSARNYSRLVEVALSYQAATQDMRNCRAQAFRSQFAPMSE